MGRKAQHFTMKLWPFSNHCGRPSRALAHSVSEQCIPSHTSLHRFSPSAEKNVSGSFVTSALRWPSPRRCPPSLSFLCRRSPSSSLPTLRDDYRWTRTATSINSSSMCATLPPAVYSCAPSTTTTTYPSSASSLSTFSCENVFPSRQGWGCMSNSFLSSRRSRLPWVGREGMGASAVIFQCQRYTSSSFDENAVDHYATLGVSPKASLQEVKAAYKKLALQYHPDRNPDDPSAEEKFKAVSAAYHVIGNKERRQQYDVERQVSAAPGGRGGGRGGMHGGGPGWGSASFSSSSAGGGSDFASSSVFGGGGRSSSRYTYQRMSKADADALFRQMFGSMRVEDLFSRLEEELKGVGGGGSRASYGGDGSIRPKTTTASPGPMGLFQAFSSPQHPFSSPTSRLFGFGGGVAGGMGGGHPIGREGRVADGAGGGESLGKEYNSQSFRRTVRVFVDGQGEKVEEQTFTGPSGTFYRVSKRHNIEGGHAEQDGGSTTHGRNPHFSRSAEGERGETTYEAHSSSTSSNRFGFPFGQFRGSSFQEGGGHQEGRASSSQSGGGEGYDVGGGGGRHSGFHGGGGGGIPFSEFARAFRYQQPPVSALESFLASLRFFAWMIIITSAVWMILATLVTHPVLTMAILFLMMVGRGRR